MRVFRYLKQNPFLLILIGIDGAAMLFPIIFDGQVGCAKAGCGFIIGTNFNDSIWFLTLANVAFSTLPFRMPNFAGALLQGYHFLPNLLVHLLSLSGIPATIWYYKVLPLLFVVGLVWLTVAFGLTQKRKLSYISFLLFFVFFGTPLSYLLSFARTGAMDNNWVYTPLYQASRATESLHFAFSLLLIFAVLILLENSKKNNISRILIGILLFIAVGTKFYGGILLLSLIGIYELISFFTGKHKRQNILSLAWYGFCFLVSVLIFFNPLQAGATGTFIFAPFSTVHHIIEDPRFFYSGSMVNARYYLYAHGFSPRLLMIELWSTLLFIFYNTGLRIVGFFYITKQMWIRKLSKIDASLVAAAILAFTITVLFIQKGAWYNTIQFGAYGAFFLALLSAKFFSELWEKRRNWSTISIVVLIFITIPATLIQFNYLGRSTRVVISRGEMEALAYLKTLPEGVVYTHIYGNDSTYVSAFSFKTTYMNGLEMLGNSGIDFSTRQKTIRLTEEIDANKLPVKYVYIPRLDPDYEYLKNKFGTASYHKIFQNDEAAIYQKLFD